MRAELISGRHAERIHCEKYIWSHRRTSSVRLLLGDTLLMVPDVHCGERCSSVTGTVGEGGSSPICGSSTTVCVEVAMLGLDREDARAGSPGGRLWAG